jgi:DNA-binding response OmpR family regulator
MKSIMSISANDVLNNILLTTVSGKYTLIPLPNVFEGLHELKRKEAIQLVLIDMDDQGPKCMDFVQHITTSWLYNRPIIILSSHMDDAKKEQLLNAGVRTLVNKPFNPVELLKKIDELVKVDELVI